MSSLSLSSKLVLLSSFLALVHPLPQSRVEKRLNNGLALTPPMGYVPSILYMSAFSDHVAAGIHITTILVHPPRPLFCPTPKRLLTWVCKKQAITMSQWTVVGRCPTGQLMEHYPGIRTDFPMDHLRCPISCTTGDLDLEFTQMEGLKCA